jgi:hypothetical protein
MLSPAGTQVTSLLVDRPVAENGDVPKLPGIQNYINGLITEDQLSEQEILNIFWVNEKQFKNIAACHKKYIGNILLLKYRTDTERCTRF